MLPWNDVKVLPWSLRKNFFRKCKFFHKWNTKQLTLTKELLSYVHLTFFNNLVTFFKFNCIYLFCIKNRYVLLFNEKICIITWCMK